MEVNLANALAIKPGDLLGFQVGDQQFKAKVFSLRSLRWDSFHPNFYMMFPPGVLNKLPATYITSFYLPPAQKNILLSLVKQFPSVTIIDIAELLSQTRLIIATITQAIVYILGFTLLAGLAILYASLQVSLDERLHESALMRALGASRKQLRLILATEFITLGMLAGLLGAICASCLSWLIANRFLEITYTMNYMYWFYSLLGGGLLIGVAGLWGARSVARQSPVNVLRENQ
jgi:putative ABC transport system permease protein